MLDAFLILGQIPGTNYRLSFTDIICGVLTMVLAWQLVHRPELVARVPFWKSHQKQIFDRRIMNSWKVLRNIGKRFPARSVNP